jgi:microcystin-dependent protein
MAFYPLTGGGGQDCPVGTILDFAGDVVPNGYLECNGAAISRTSYAELFAVLGTKWGSGDGKTTFNLPDFRDRVSVGRSSSRALASTGGEETHVLTPSETATKDHAHTLSNHTHDLSNHYHTTYIGSHEHNVIMRSSSRGLCDTNWEAEGYGLTQTPGFKNRVIIWRDWVYSDNWAAYSAATDLGSKNSGGPSNNTSGGPSTNSTGGLTAANGSAHNNMQPYATTMKIIRAVADIDESYHKADIIVTGLPVFGTVNADTYTPSQVPCIVYDVTKNALYYRT